MTPQLWLDHFAQNCALGDGPAIAHGFEALGFWRDYLPFGWTLQTLEGQAAIAAFGAANGPTTGFRDPVMEDATERTEGFFQFRTNDGPGRGHIRLQNGRCKTLFTMLENLDAPSHARDEPFVLIVGGGQGGLALGAQLSDLDVPYLIVDSFPRVGDQWRSRYDSLILHDPVWYDHMPFRPFPSDWPVFTPKDQMGDWLENYAEDLDLNIWTSTTLANATFESESGTWTAAVIRDNKSLTITATHVVMALGLSGFPNVPTFPGQDSFRGAQMHSSAFKVGEGFTGQSVAVIGANNSAHDIAQELVRVGAHPTLVQRSSSLVVRQEDYVARILGTLYSAEAVAAGITTDKADILQAAMPLRMMEPAHRTIWDGIRADQKAYYQRLTDAGFALDFAEDGTGLGMKYRRTASGYYIDVGAADMVMDGRIAIKSGQGIDHLTEDAIHFEDGSALQADAIVYATGYGGMTDWVATLIDQDTADRVGPCWGYGSGTKGDPGPWIGELRNMWVQTAQKNLWFTGGNLSQARFYSRLLALQLAKQR